MEEALELARSKDSKDRAAGTERLHSLLESSGKPLSAAEVASLVTTCIDLLNDTTNPRASLGAFQCLASTAVLSPDRLRVHFDAVLPAVVERLGDEKLPLRDAARGLLLTLMEVSSPTIIIERAGSAAWMHAITRVREEFVRIVTAAVTVFASAEQLTLLRVVLPHILRMLNDSTLSIKEAAMLCVEEMYMQFGSQFRDELQNHSLPSSLVGDINIRLEKIEPKVCGSDATVRCTYQGEIKPANINEMKSGPKTSNSACQMPVSGGGVDLKDKPIDPVTVYSDKIHRRQASSSLRERGVQVSHRTSLAPSFTNLPGDEAPASRAVPLGSSLSSGLLSSEVKSHVNVTERSVENMQHPSRQKVTATQRTLSSLDTSHEKHNFQNQRLTSLGLGLDPPSARDLSHSRAFAASAVGKRASEGLEGGFMEEHSDERVARRSLSMHTDRQHMNAPSKDANFRDGQGNNIPHFQRPLLRKQISSQVSTNNRSFFDDTQILLGEMSNNVDGPASLHDALTEGLSPNCEWYVRVAAFDYVKSVLQDDPKGSQEIVQNFEKVMKLFFQHLDDPHHKVAQAALSALLEIIPACRKPFESYLDRILHHIFSRLIDPKELVRQLSSTILEVVSKAYSIDSLLPALLRALDEQRSPKVKLAVIEYAINSLKNNATCSEGAGNFGILKRWLAKLIPLVYEKNTKLKEAAISCIIFIHTNYDSSAVLNYILCLSVQEQNSLRRALRQRSPRIEMDFMNFLQNKRERQRPRNISDQFDLGISTEGGCQGTHRKNINFGRYYPGCMDIDCGSVGLNHQTVTNEAQEHLNQNVEYNCKNILNSKDLTCNFTTADENVESCMRSPGDIEQGKMDNPSSLDNKLMSSSHDLSAGGSNAGAEAVATNCGHENSINAKFGFSMNPRIIIPQIIYQISNGNESSNLRKQALQQLIEASITSNNSVWNKYFNQILKVVLEALDDSDSSIREATLQLLAQMVDNQKNLMEDSIEVVIEKLLHVTNDKISEVSNEAEKCLSIVLTEYDPFSCLNAIVAMLITDDESALLTCIHSLTKLVGRLSQVELLDQLPSFLPLLFDAFGNQSAHVRKTVVFCLVDIYVKLGKAFLPYLEDLNSTQLRLVTLYANRVAQARKGTNFDATHGTLLETA
ncbi:hypothetical protein SLEP1_g29740 [Rubroshorea leprosula]|uniref:TOG domain-containing protein n=1 Tax=Rubroshorea leprosula TaxID=152421 RepID=A0AAV5K7Q5_9ROSI|nr:hypothetical protein SLEP1_g29740 [Rubroshorea leprosula]